MAKEVGKEDLMELDRQAQLAWDMAKAVEWYEKSAMFSWEDIYNDGDGNVEQDLTKAKEWYGKAKDAGSGDAEQLLADLS